MILEELWATCKECLVSSARNIYGVVKIPVRKKSCMWWNKKVERTVEEENTDKIDARQELGSEKEIM